MRSRKRERPKLSWPFNSLASDSPHHRVVEFTRDGNWIAKHSPVRPESDRIYDSGMDVRLKRNALWARAVELFGSESKADIWFHTRLLELADRTPEEVLDEGVDTEQVAAILDRIDYGVFI